MKRSAQIILISTFLAFSWLGMQVVHEFGHCLGAWFSGGRVARIIAHPFTISCTVLSHNPRPLFVVWSGPIFGSILPALAVLIAALFRAPALYMFRFFAGFCLVANGLYIGLGALGGLLDAGDMMSYGSPQWLLFVFGGIAITVGLYFWNGIGLGFGLGEANGSVHRKAVISSVVLLSVLVVCECVLGR